jgi:hypothetical protein
VTATDLIEALKETGTGERFLSPMRELVRVKHDATGLDAYQALASHHDHLVRNGATLAKAKRLLAGERVSDINGSPPTSRADAATRELVRKISDTMAQRVAEKAAQAQTLQLGLPPAAPEGTILDASRRSVSTPTESPLA